MNKLSAFTLLFFVGLLSACRQEPTLEQEPYEQVPAQVALRTSAPTTDKDGYVPYVIPKGQFYAQPSYFQEVKNTVISFKAIFNKSAIYQTKVAANQFSINKLYGFSDCGAHHQVNSARFGWIWLNNALRIYTYCYVNGKRIPEVELGTVEFDKAMDYKIEIKNNRYIFTFKGKQTIVNRGCTDTKGFKYKLFPYFGGTEPAPQEILIKIKES